MILLDPHVLRGVSPANVRRRLQRIVRANRFEIDHAACGFRILGPDVSYHSNDPFLEAGLTYLRRDRRLDDALSFHARTPAFDLCLEDSWSGYFVAEWLHASPAAGDLVFVHLDHHTDMMSSLLERRGGTLVDPTDERPFDPGAAADWRKGIAAGSIGIGSFVTTLFELPRQVHVRHINNYTSSDYATYRVVRSVRTFRELPGRAFACIRKRRDDPPGAVGTYRGGCDAGRVLAGLPAGRTVVHVDLDYLINDFNGNEPDAGWAPAPGARDDAARKLDRFFAALRLAGRAVDRWIVAASPGFCSASHWPWLFESLEERIERMAPASLPQPAVVASAGACEGSA